MAREIKFRGWNLTEKTMGEPFTLQQAIGSRKVDGVFTGDVEYMQSTGRLDTDGKEIFEGDILVVRHVHDGHEDYWNSTEQKAIPFTIQYDLTHGFNVPRDSYWFEVIGNIYENPDLMQYRDSRRY